MNCSIEDSQENVVNSPNMMGGVIVYLGFELVDKLDIETPIENRIIFQIVNC